MFVVNMEKDQTLTPQVTDVVVNKATERAYTGRYNDFSAIGSYLCRRCGLALFRSTSKFISSCGWPSFDDELPNAIVRLLDADGKRQEIVCNRCGGHLGHVFVGEQLTEKNLRHCVNSLAIDFVANSDVIDSEEAIYAGGCFWGVQALLAAEPGVLGTEVGYTGGNCANPSYEAVCGGNTGHYEAIRVIYDPNIISYQQLSQAFFEIHNPEQRNGQGPDIGTQYQSAIFYYSEQQQQVAKDLIAMLESNNLAIATKLLPATIFWPAEEYHQNYYKKNKGVPYCHIRTRKF